ncbi:MAG: elongation factor Ts [Oscillospiraceae bacterium]|nr:elongation factor Ts [Oscillospiraceae bacterium]
MAFTAKDVQTLRERTGCGMMDCKKALTETNGDMEKAIEVLREKGLAAAAKKSGRIAAEGVVCVKVEDGVAAIVEVNAETDFVAKNETFIAFANDIAKTVISENPADLDALMTLKLNGSDMTVEEALRDKILVIGENMKIRRFERVEGDVVGYSHGGGRIGVLVKMELEGAAKGNATALEAGKDVAMQIAALNAPYLDKESVPAEVLESEKQITIAQFKNDPKHANKPDQVLEKMVMGKMGKYYENNCVLCQAFVKDGDKTVSQYLADVSKEVGGKVNVTGFIRFEKGEGLEKKQDNFAEEVASMMK